MKKTITKACIQKVKSSFNLADYIANHTHLQSEGSVMVGKSPLVDDDQENSLSVDVAKGRFRCKATEASGDIIDYERAFGGTKFVETVEYLAMLGGLDIEYVQNAKPRESKVSAA